MSTFQILMFAATLFFAYQIFRHVQELEDGAPSVNADASPLMSDEGTLVDEADKAYEAGDLDLSKEKLEKANVLSPDTPEILNKLAFVCGKVGETSKAIELYRRSLSIDEGDDLAHNALASLYRSEGSFELAREHYEKALRIDDAYAMTYYNYGNLLVDLGAKEEAARMYEEALRLQGDFSEAEEALASLRGEA